MPPDWLIDLPDTTATEPEICAFAVLTLVEPLSTYTDPPLEKVDAPARNNTAAETEFSLLAKDEPVLITMLPVFELSPEATRTEPLPWLPSASPLTS